MVGWVERSEPHHALLGILVGLAALDPPYIGFRYRNYLLHPA